MKDNFDLKKYLAEGKLLKEELGVTVAKGIDDVINNVDENLDYTDFAKAVAIILKDNYGTHNIAPFMKVLHTELEIK